VGCRFEDRSQIKAVNAQVLEMVQPAENFLKARSRRGIEIVLLRRAAQAEGINMVKDGLPCPMIFHVSPPVIPIGIVPK
jgi:hypothetical protein